MAGEYCNQAVGALRKNVAERYSGPANERGGFAGFSRDS